MSSFRKTLGALLVAGLGCRTAQTAAVASAPPAAGPLVLVTGADGLLAINPDTGEAVRWEPTAASAEQLLAGPTTLYGGRLLSLDGRGLDLPLPSGGRDLSISPDKKSLVYAQSGAGLSASVRIIGVDGRGDRPLTDEGGAPTWLADGRIGLRSGDQRSGTAIFRVGADGSGLERLAETPGEGIYALDWGQDGSVVFAARVAGDKAGETRSILRWTDGVNTQILHDAGSGGEIWEPRRSTAGDRVAFIARAPNEGDRHSPATLWVSALDQAAAQPLFALEALVPGFTGGAYAGVGSISWSPDGSQLAFLAAMEGDCRKNGNGDLICRYDLYVVGVDGKGKRRVSRLGLSSAPLIVWAR